MLADKLKELRLKNNMTQEELSRRLYVSRQAITSWECNRSMPDIDTIVELSKLFNVSIEYLLDEDNKRPPKRKKGIATLIVISILLSLGALGFLITYLYFKIADNFTVKYLPPQYSLVGYYLSFDEELRIDSPSELKDYNIPYIIYMDDRVEANLFYFDGDEYRLFIPDNSYNSVYSYHIYYESVGDEYYTGLSFKNEDLYEGVNLHVGSINDIHIWYEIRNPSPGMDVISYDSDGRVCNIDSFFYSDDGSLYKNGLKYEDSSYIDSYYYEGAAYYTVKLLGSKTYNLFSSKEIYTNLGLPGEKISFLRTTNFIIKPKLS